MSIIKVTDLYTTFHNEDKFKFWLDMITMISDLDDAGFSDMQHMTNQFLNRAIGRSLSEANRSFQQRVIRMWKTTPGVIHRCARGVLDKADEIMGADRVFASPTEMMGHRADTWQN
eukprot:6517732-Pyramimonas_sp.AAC.1